MTTSTASSPVHALADRLAGVGALDPAAKRIGKAVRNAIGPGTVKDLLSGTWLGHAVHPVLTDVVIGTWTSANLLDVIGGEDAGPAAERLIGVGLAASVPTVVTGMTDWADSEAVEPAVRRIGILHAATNTAALGLYAASLAARRRGRRGRGAALAGAGAGVLAAGGWLGGHLGYVEGVGVDQTTFDRGPDEWTRVLRRDELPDGGSATADAAGTPVLLVRDGARLHALHDRCSHRGCSLGSGDIAEGVVTCPCHGSRFALADGAVLRGPATVGQPALEAREDGDWIAVRLRD